MLALDLDALMLWSVALKAYGEFPGWPRGLE